MMKSEDSKKTFFLETLGCPKNEVDSETIEVELTAAGLTRISEPELADLVIVNSCGFIRDAKIETIHCVLNLHEMRKRGSVLVLCGCLPARYDLQRSLDEVDIFLPWQKHGQLVTRLREIGWPLAKQSLVLKRTAPLAPFGYLKISEGCDNRCAYCAIPDIKGPFTSRPLSAIMREAEFLCDRGTRELVLIGQDTTLYGRNAEEEASLPLLLERLTAIRSCEWIRLMYAHPAHLSEDAIEALATIDKMVKYIDLPLQHINDRILTRMNRKVGRRQIENLIERLRSRIPGIVLRTTFIVGFPGETDKEFGELLDFCEKTQFDNVGVFKYSPEDGTPAYAFSDRLEEEVVEERYLTLLDAQNMISGSRLARRVNLEERVLLHSVNSDGIGYGRGWFQAPEVDGQVIIEGCKRKPGQFVDVTITRYDAYDLYARQSEMR
jgi:ribosomal protein S12 methylthiotransferase